MPLSAALLSLLIPSVWSLSVFCLFKRVCIVSKDYERIRQYITGKLHRGCTLYEVIGGYSGEKSIELEVLLSKDDFSSLLNWLKSENINAFTTANNVSEVYGLWFSGKKRKQLEEEMNKR